MIPEPPECAIAPRIPGYLYDTAVHGGFDPGDRDDLFAARHPELAELARSVANVTDTPYLAPEHYAVVLAELAREINEHGFQLTRTSKAVRDRCIEEGAPIARASVNFILRGITFGGHRFGQNGSEEPMALGNCFFRNVLSLCDSAGLPLNESEQDVLSEWILGELRRELSGEPVSEEDAEELEPAGVSEEEPAARGGGRA